MQELILGQQKRRQLAPFLRQIFKPRVQSSASIRSIREFMRRSTGS